MNVFLRTELCVYISELELLKDSIRCVFDSNAKNKKIAIFSNASKLYIGAVTESFVKNIFVNYLQEFLPNFADYSKISDRFDDQLLKNYSKEEKSKIKKVFKDGSKIDVESAKIYQKLLVKENLNNVKPNNSVLRMSNFKCMFGAVQHDKFCLVKEIFSHKNLKIHYGIEKLEPALVEINAHTSLHHFIESRNKIAHEYTGNAVDKNDLFRDINFFIALAKDLCTAVGVNIEKYKSGKIAVKSIEWAAKPNLISLSSR